MSTAQEKTKKEDVKKTYLVYSETRSGGDIREGEESSDWPCYEDIDIEFTPEYILIAGQNSIERAPGLHSYNYDNLGWDLDNTWDEANLLIVRYSDGGTFGQANGYWKVIACYKNWTEADKALAEFDPKTYQGYHTWDGYFSSYQDIELHSLKVRRRDG